MAVDKTQVLVIGAAVVVALAVFLGAAWYTGYLSKLGEYLPFGGGEEEVEMPDVECDWPEIPDGEGCCIDENKNDFCDYLDEFAGKETPVTTSVEEATTSVEETTTTVEEASTTPVTTTPEDTPNTSITNETTAQATTSTPPTTSTFTQTTTTIQALGTGVELVFKADNPTIPLYTDSRGFSLTLMNIGSKKAERVRVMALLPDKRVLSSIPHTFDVEAGEIKNVTVNVRYGMIRDGQFVLFEAETKDNQKFSQWLQIEVRQENQASGEWREKF
ncbi:hypothetical protein ACFLRC_00845 [Candidatus Altiarchaeota archaeon]